MGIRRICSILFCKREIRVTEGGERFINKEKYELCKWHRGCFDHDGEEKFLKRYGFYLKGYNWKGDVDG